MVLVPLWVSFYAYVLYGIEKLDKNQNSKYESVIKWIEYKRFTP